MSYASTWYIGFIVQEDAAATTGAIEMAATIGLVMTSSTVSSNTLDS